MRKIALRGLFGRKRDSLLLWSVVTLSFLFLVLSTTLITSLKKTDEEQRISTYGSWQVMAGGLDETLAESFAAKGEISAVLPMINVEGIDYFTGDNSYYLSVYSPELEELGSFKLKEGRWPEGTHEVALEYARLSSSNLKLGDSFTVTCTLQLPANESYSAYSQQRLAQLQQQAKEAALARALELWRSGLWQEQIKNIHGFNNDPVLGFFLGWERMQANRLLFGETLPIEQMDEAQFTMAAEYYFEAAASLLDMTPYMTEEELFRAYTSIDLLGYEELNIRVSVDSEYITVIIPYEYTVCGVLETYSDRWDSGGLSLPAGFVTEECYKRYLAAQSVVTEKYFDYDSLDFEHMLLLSAGDSEDARALWESLRPEYNSYLFENSRLIRCTALSSYDGREQIGFEFCLADGEKQKVIPIEGWLIPEEPSPNYESSGSLAGRAVMRHSYWEGFLDGLEGAQVAFDCEGQRCTLPLEEFLSGEFDVDGKKLCPENILWAENADELDEYCALRINSFAYPSSAEGSDRMLVLVTAILFVTTVCAVFQIFFTQMRRRLRRIVLMKSVGAESGQIGRMMAWEFIYFWLSAMPVGAILGLLGAKLAAALLGSYQGRAVLFTLDASVFLAALAAGTFALLLGMAVPMVLAVGVPLTGRTVRKKPLPKPKADIKQDFFNISLRWLKVNRSRSLGSAALCLFMMLIGCLCLFLGFRFLAPYREAVERNAKPDYHLELPFSISDRQIEAYELALEELGVCESVEIYRRGDDTIVSAADADSILLETASGGGPRTVGELEGYDVELRALDTGTELFEKYKAAITAGSVDETAFEAGRQVILMIPLYKDTGRVNEDALEKAEGWERLAASGIDTSYYAEYARRYERDGAVAPGDTLHFAAETRFAADDSYRYDQDYAEAKVAAIIYYFPEQGIWPVSGSGEGYQVMCSSALIRQLLPNSIRTVTESTARALKVAQLTSGYGATDFFIMGREELSREEVDTALLVYARSNYMDIEFYHESSDKLLRDGINNILLTCLLGLTAVLLALVIFSNTVTSDIEQERSRLGILQSLGVSNRQLVKRQLYIGLAASGTALILANLLLWGVLALYALISGKVLGNLLWGYPWWLHGLLCLVLCAVMTLLYMAPMFSLRKYLPIENIRSGK